MADLKRFPKNETHQAELKLKMDAASSLRILANCQSLNFQHALGVPHYTTNLLRSLRRDFNVHVTCLVDDRNRDVVQQRELCDAAITSPPSARSHFDLEYQAHHFQQATTRFPQVATFFDMHVFDVSWKYEARAGEMQHVFRTNAENADAILTPFVRTAERLREYVSTSAEVFLVKCPPLLGDVALKPHLLGLLQTRFMLSDDVKLVYYPATLQKHKNHENLFRALRALIQRGYNIALVCSGPDFTQEITTELKQLAEQLGIRDRVAFTGLLPGEHVRALYALADLIVSPSLAEGGAATVQEAIQFGRPAVCSNIEAAQMHLELMGADVPTFNPNDVVDMTNQIEWALANGTQIIDQNRQALSRIENWTWSSTAARYAEVMRWVKNGKPIQHKPELLGRS